MKNIRVLKPMTKKEFLDEHNRLSPPNLQATFAMLTAFEEEKNPELKANLWSMERLRAPFISWLLTLTRKNEKESDHSGYRNYPETKF